jgi:hypothetical protein
MEQLRAEKGRFGTKPRPSLTGVLAREMTPSATPALDLIRASENRQGLIIEPPIPFDEMRRIRQPSSYGDFERQAHLENDLRIQALKGWLRETAESGLPRDLERAWAAWKPFHPPTKHVLRGDYDELMAKCRRRESELALQADAEQHPFRARNMYASVLAQLREKKRKAEEDLAKITAELEGWERQYSEFQSANEGVTA